jgi:hypothetical protein
MISKTWFLQYSQHECYSYSSNAGRKEGMHDI